jgi:hypothetical protein
MATMKPRLTNEYFVGEILILNLTGDGDPVDANQTDLRYYFTVYEIRYLKLLLGYDYDRAQDGEDLFTEFNDALVAADNDYDSLSSKWQDLHDQIYPLKTDDNPFYVSPAAYYVYFFYTRQNVKIKTTTGNATPVFENAVASESVNTLVFAWNRMAELSDDISEWLLDNVSTYDTYVAATPNLLTPINRFGI